MAGTDILINPSSKDIDFTNNTITLVQSIEDLARQKIAITLRAFKGEWDFNINFGIPYTANENNSTQLLGVPVANKRLLDFEIRQAILDKEEILSILSFESTISPETRVYSLSFEALTEEGPITFEGDLQV